MTPPLDRLYLLASNTLDDIVAGWPGDATPLPSYRYVSAGPAPADFCETLAVWVERDFTIEADVTVEQFISGTNLAGRAAVVAVSLMRCVPSMDDQGRPPGIAEQDEAAQVVLTDAQALFNVLLDANRELAGCNGFSFENGTVIDPAGGSGGWTLRFRASLL